MRLLSVYLPMWPIDRLRRRLTRAHDEQADSTQHAARPPLPPLLLTHTRASIQYIAACCHISRKCGVRPGMMLAHARAMIAGQHSPPRIEDFDPPAERAAMLRLAHWAALRYSPLVSVDPCALSDKISAEDPLPDGLLMNITGCDQLFTPGPCTSALRAENCAENRGEHSLAQSLLESLSRAGFEARIGIAPTIGAAWAAARFGSDQISMLSSDPRTLRKQLSPIPARALRIELQAEQALLELGLETIGHILALPRSSLPSRFGTLLIRRIDQTFGSAIELIEPVRPAPPLRLERLFEGPTPQLEAIESCTRELLMQLSRELLHRESGLRLLEAIYERVGRNGRGTEPLIQRITLSRPSRDPRHLWSLLRPRIEKMHLGYGIESITLIARCTARLRHRQQEYIKERHHIEASGHEAGELIDTLANRLGADRVLRAEPVESHIPERAARFVPVVELTSTRVSTHAPPAPHASPAPSSRPTILFDHPEPAEAIALQPDRPPTLLRWRGEERRIITASGPERIAGEWWNVPTVPPTVALHGRCNSRTDPNRCNSPQGRDAWERDYFRLCDHAGRWLWVFREIPLFRVQDLAEAASRPPRWFVHGIWA